jgi:hypothetical protein
LILTYEEITVSVRKDEGTQSLYDEFAGWKRSRKAL